MLKDRPTSGPQTHPAVPWHNYKPADRPVLPDLPVLHADGPMLGRDDLATLGLDDDDIEALLWDRNAVAEGELPYLLHSRRRRGGR
jgi:hypothetical protein